MQHAVIAALTCWSSWVGGKWLEADVSVKVEPEGCCEKDRLATGGWAGGCQG